MQKSEVWQHFQQEFSFELLWFRSFQSVTCLSAACWLAILVSPEMSQIMMTIIKLTWWYKVMGNDDLVWTENNQSKQKKWGENLS